MIEHVADIPDPPAFGLFSRQIRLILDGVAEAGRADQGTVAAAEAAAGHLIPLGVIIAIIQKTGQIVGFGVFWSGFLPQPESIPGPAPARPELPAGAAVWPG